MTSISSVARIAALVGDPSRANILIALLGGRALTSGELARAAGVTASTASTHLRQLEEAAMICGIARGRHRYYALASRAVAAMLESLLALPEPPLPPCLPLTGPRDPALRQARRCYDHLAGKIAVQLFDRLVVLEAIETSAEGAAITPSGIRLLINLGVTLPADSDRRLFCRQCLDWSERRFHLGGAVGAALMNMVITQRWFACMEGTRAVRITAAGRTALKNLLGIDVAI